ncbi:diguanylate cyclase [Actinophytocola glycyrrhizae]|uniref:Diguanylate cyclase n=1 Tax=Actinophytocola glycyrrhizae TaxID=2044873 RepID=A0ABV9S0W7_9PSEU
MELAAAATVLSTIPLFHVTPRDWLWFGLLALAAVFHLEAARGLERVREVTAEGSPHTHLQSVWFFAALLLVPPPLVVGILLISYAHSWLRVYRRRALVHRKVFSASTVVLGLAGAYVVLAAIYPAHTEPFAVTLSGPIALVAVVAAGFVYWFANYALVVGVILLTNPDQPARKALGRASDQLMIAGAIGLGTGMTVVMMSQPWWTPLLIVTVLALHMGLLLPQFRDASRTDAKTGLFEPTFWAELTNDELDRARRLNGTLGLLLLDLDHFKRVNDGYGHLAGDMVLRAVADAIRHSVRGHDMVGRYGGEEFAIVLPGLGVEDVRAAAERVRAAINELAVTVPDLDGDTRVIRGLTASVGASVFPLHGTERTTLLLAADAALYEAKTAGRDRTRLADETPRIVPAARRSQEWHGQAPGPVRDDAGQAY